MNRAMEWIRASLTTHQYTPHYKSGAFMAVMGLLVAQDAYEHRAILASKEDKEKDEYKGIVGGTNPIFGHIIWAGITTSILGTWSVPFQLCFFYPFRRLGAQVHIGIKFHENGPEAGPASGPSSGPSSGPESGPESGPASGPPRA